MIPFIQVTNLMSPTIAPAFWLEKVSRLWCMEREQSQSLADSLGWGNGVEFMERKGGYSSWSRVMEKRENSRGLQRIALDNWPKYWSTHACEETSRGLGKNCPKDLKGTAPGAHLGPGIVSASMWQTGKTNNFSTLRRVVRKLLPQ